MGYPHEVIFKVKIAIIQIRGFSHLKGTHRHVFLYNISRIYMSNHILLEGVYLVLSYSTHIWNAYVAGYLLKIKTRKMMHAYNKDKTHSIILKQRDILKHVTFHEHKQQYLYQYMTKFKSVFFTEIIRQISYIFLNYTQLT